MQKCRRENMTVALKSERLNKQKYSETKNLLYNMPKLTGFFKPAESPLTSPETVANNINSTTSIMLAGSVASFSFGESEGPSLSDLECAVTVLLDMGMVALNFSINQYQISSLWCIYFCQTHFPTIFPWYTSSSNLKRSDNLFQTFSSIKNVRLATK